MPIKILCVAGARPNFIKIAPLMRGFAADPLWDARLIHTGQHYDERLSKIFFDELAIAPPHLSLAVGSASHAGQTAEIIRRFEPVLEAEQPKAVLVVGDVNSTIACGLVAAKFQLREAFAFRGTTRSRPVLIHVEAGLRSFDDEMPEEINRRLTDTISDVLFVSEEAGLVNLKREGVEDHRVFLVGNVMIDTLLHARDRAKHSPILSQLVLEAGAYNVLTLHRPSNVDDPTRLVDLLTLLDRIAQRLPLVFPIHPRTHQRLAACGVTLAADRWKTIEPVGYLDFMKLQAEARVVFTDSGGIQEETTVLGVPCVTLRDNTERPVTILEGTNILAGTDEAKVLTAFEQALSMERKTALPRYWDGQAAQRICSVLGGLFRS
jgi:UDP-N-acetylglucosamine 2-epimerase (non-hydrolysing)